MTSSVGEVVFDYSSCNGRYVLGSGMLEFETAWTKASDTSIHVYNDPPSINGVALARGCTLISHVENASTLDYTSRTRTPRLGQVVVLRNTGGFYAALHVLEIKDDSRADDRDELRFRYADPVRWFGPVHGIREAVNGFPRLLARALTPCIGNALVRRNLPPLIRSSQLVSNAYVD